MAHNLESKNGIVSFIHAESVKVWHGLGRMYKKLTKQIILDENFIDYKVEKTEVITKINGIEEVFEKNYVTYRTDTGKRFATVSDQYEVIQNIDALNLVEALANNANAEYLTAGVIDEGQRMFVSMKTPKNIVVNGSNDPINEHLTIVNEHTGKQSLFILFTPIVVVCENTLNMALSKSTIKNRFAIQHKGTSVVELLNNPEALKEKILEYLNVEDKYLVKCESLYNSMAATKVNINEFLCKSFLDLKAIEKNNGVFLEKLNWDYTKAGLTERGKDVISKPKIEMFNDIINYYDTDKFGQNLANRRGTVYGALQAVTGYYSNVKFIGKDTAEKFSAIQFGSAKDNAQLAFDTALTLIN